jgi:hypothetical protein
VCAHATGARARHPSGFTLARPFPLGRKKRLLDVGNEKRRRLVSLAVAPRCATREWEETPDATATGAASGRALPLRSYPSHLVDGRHRQLAPSGWPPAGSRLSPADKRATCQHGGPTQAAGESQARSRSFTARGPWALGLAVCVGASATLSVRPSRPAHLACPWVQPPSLSPFVPVCCLHEKVLW